MPKPKFTYKINKTVRLNLYKICRLCGMDNTGMIQILDEGVDYDEPIQSNENVALARKIWECVSLKVHKSDNMPQMICPECVEKINDIYDFRDLVQTSNTQTRKLLGIVDKPEVVQKKKKKDVKLEESSPLMAKKLKIELIDPSLPSRKRSRKQDLSQILDDTVKIEPPSKVGKKGETSKNVVLVTGKKQIKKNAEERKLRMYPRPCQLCKLMLTAKTSADIHMTTLHTPQISEFGCASCCEMFTSQLEYDDHIEWHENTFTMFVCPNCHLAFPSIKDFKKHMTLPIGCFQTEPVVTDTDPCSNCGLRFETQNLYDWHECFITSNGNCPKCNKSFAKKNTLFRHLFKCTAVKLELQDEKPDVSHLVSCTMEDGSNTIIKTEPGSIVELGEDNMTSSTQYGEDHRTDVDEVMEPLAKRKHTKSRPSATHSAPVVLPMFNNIRIKSEPIDGALKRTHAMINIPIMNIKKEVVDSMYDEQIARNIKMEPGLSSKLVRPSTSKLLSKKKSSPNPARSILKIKIKKEHGTFNSSFTDNNLAVDLTTPPDSPLPEDSVSQDGSSEDQRSGASTPADSVKSTDVLPNPLKKILYKKPFALALKIKKEKNAEKSTKSTPLEATKPKSPSIAPETSETTATAETSAFPMITILSAVTTSIEQFNEMQPEPVATDTANNVSVNDSDKTASNEIDPLLRVKSEYDKYLSINPFAFGFHKKTSAANSNEAGKPDDTDSEEVIREQSSCKDNIGVDEIDKDRDDEVNQEIHNGSDKNVDKNDKVSRINNAPTIKPRIQIKKEITRNALPRVVNEIKDCSEELASPEALPLKTNVTESTYIIKSPIVSPVKNTLIISSCESISENDLEENGLMQMENVNLPAITEQKAQKSNEEITETDDLSKSLDNAVKSPKKDDKDVISEKAETKVMEVFLKNSSPLKVTAPLEDPSSLKSTESMEETLNSSSPLKEFKLTSSPVKVTAPLEDSSTTSSPLRSIENKSKSSSPLKEKAPSSLKDDLKPTNGIDELHLNSPIKVHSPLLVAADTMKELRKDEKQNETDSKKILEDSPSSGVEREDADKSTAFGRSLLDEFLEQSDDEMLDPTTLVDDNSDILEKINSVL